MLQWTNKLKNPAFLAVVLSACTQTQKWETSWDKVIDQPGVNVKITEDKKGNAIREITLPHNVIITEERRGDHISTLEVDGSGNGAVICGWELYTAVRRDIEKCPSNQYGQMKQKLDGYIDRINAFIVANSIDPVTQSQLDEQVRKRIVSAKKCNASGTFNKALQSNEKRELFIKTLDDAVNKMLSVPRLPVLNPCL